MDKSKFGMKCEILEIFTIEYIKLVGKSYSFHSKLAVF